VDDRGDGVQDDRDVGTIRAVPGVCTGVCSVDL